MPGSHTTSRRDAHVVHLLAGGVILTNAAGNCLLRAGLDSTGPLLSFSPLAYLYAFGHPAVILGVAFLTVWLLLQLLLLSWADLTYVLPVTSASYILTTLIGQFALGEHVSAIHWCGVLLIVSGVMMVWKTRPLTTGSRRK